MIFLIFLDNMHLWVSELSTLYFWATSECLNIITPQCLLNNIINDNRSYWLCYIFKSTLWTMPQFSGKTKRLLGREFLKYTAGKQQNHLQIYVYMNTKPTSLLYATLSKSPNLCIERVSIMIGNGGKKIKLRPPQISFFLFILLLFLSC